MMRQLYNRFPPILALVSVLAAGACGDDDSTGPEVFSEPDLVEIRVGSTVIATATRALTSGDAFVLQSGVEVGIEVNFLNLDGTLVTPLSGEFLDVLIDDETIGTFTPDQAGAFTGALKGLAPGTTGVVFRYMYGGLNSTNAKASFVSAKFDFIVPGAESE